MIIDTEGMKKIETDSGIPVDVLMETAGSAAADALRKVISPEEKVLILMGSGNNGGDGSVIARLLKDEYACRIVSVCGSPKTDAAKKAYAKVPRRLKAAYKNIESEIENADVLIDTVYGFGYHGNLRSEVRKVFRMANASGRRIYSIDINSGAEADTGYFDSDALRSEITFALDCYKPFHMMRKDHHLFKNVQLLDLGLPHHIESSFAEMNEDIFFSKYPRRAENSYKGSEGRTFICGGCFGMAGALNLNITGAKTVGASYIEAALPDSIYHIAALRHTSVVFHPFGYNTAQDVVTRALEHAKACTFGSGAVYMERKKECMDVILQNSRGPVVLDAEALRMLVQNTYLLRFVKCPVIMTPHIGEFASLINESVETIEKHRYEYARAFALEHHVYLVLKGPNTIVVSPEGKTYINQSGNEDLATAGSGDVLSGMIAAMCTQVPDVFDAITMAVWLHGHLADLARETFAAQMLDLESFPAIMNKLLKKHGY